MYTDIFFDKQIYIFYARPLSESMCVIYDIDVSNQKFIYNFFFLMLKYFCNGETKILTLVLSII